MGLDTAPNATELFGAVNGVTLAGGLIGALLQSEQSDRLGRKKSVALSCAICVLGGALQAGSVHIAMFIVSRLIAGLGVGALIGSIPLYQSEISPPKSRGLIVGFHGIFISLGTIMCDWIGYGFYFVNAGGSQWRVPLAIQCLPTLILGVGIFLVPESPRWCKYAIVPLDHADTRSDKPRPTRRRYASIDTTSSQQGRS